MTSGFYNKNYFYTKWHHCILAITMRIEIDEVRWDLLTVLLCTTKNKKT